MNSKATYRFKQVLFAGILLVLCLPLLQQHLRLIHVSPLKGAIKPLEKVYFSKSGWWEGAYQENYNNWFNENFGFRNTLVRLHNQLALDLYHTAKANGVIVGKDGYLYELNYIKAYTGQDYIGDDAVKEVMHKLKAVQDSLEKRNVTLVVCLAAGKASFYPEYIPDEFGKAADKTNYKIFARELQANNINHIDFNKWFVDRKNTSPYLLYPKTGIHWSRYGSLQAADSLVKWVEWKRKVDVSNMVWDKVLLSDSIRSPDDDIGEAMNIMFPFRPLKMGYPEYHYQDTTGKQKVRLMTISDSFFWNFFDVGLAPNSFSEITFYYYNKEIHHSNGSPMGYSDPEQTNADAEKHDVIMIMATESNLSRLGWGFINQAYDHFVLHKKVENRDRLINKYESSIRMDKTWMQAIQKKAAEKGIPLDSMIRLDAIFMAEQEMK
ncbi:MAG: sugar O-acetyltransferase [Bacteroidia bacterium]